mmetsp:Transcript_1193/g.1938  ORF Transcript_1193/g.1938 Transcript_1193/m.1938 type:complete len:1119 (-) Transcript_1193:206-3562(-)|eukprot:CAMPEP_0185039244 /NCGR_PEP_ID=MMETSP1103-20130426/35897_1 /TAXON_ID=36769 /ORGANISM="Paraphysomonas bandaiensis, Strain Caron Lab Isolate" /LENGTH=1118 /DNA_ID=CAMNT_0027578053 /DNA_START=109 /DNA_END=3465 /DNA_ORIENTATION=+
MAAPGMMATAGRKLEDMAQMVAQMEEDGVAGEHMKAMWAGQSNILVAVRVRPILKHDVIKNGIVRVLDAKVVIIMDPSHDKNDVLRGKRSREKQYAFDYVFEPGSSQQSVYNHTSKFLIQGVLDGYNATVFAYGNTGAGKTHTMIGSKAEPGIMVRVMNDLFHYSEKNGKRDGVAFKITVSFLEVYNENIKDLLSDVEEYLDLREDPIAGPMVAGITEVETKSSEEIMNLLHTGNQRRTQQATAANEVSSRSHAVLQVVVECKDRAPGTVANIKVGKLSLVDLAGSERAANTKNSGKRLVEGANINRSLLALGNCINALGEKGHKGNFVPYRDSKLTRLLKDSLGGNCRTVMIANISSAESSFEETLNTLKYANRAKNIKTNVQRNVLNVNHHISEYVSLITNLRSEIKVLKDQISSQAAAPVVITDPPSPKSGNGQNQHHPPSPLQVLRQPSTPLQALRDSMRSAASLRSAGEGREIVNSMRQKIVDNFQERMQLRRSLIELEDQNVQNSIEVSKRQLIVVQWSGNVIKANCQNPAETLDSAQLTTQVLANGPPEVKEALSECEQLRKAISKNNAMKRNIEKRLRNNEKDAEAFRTELGSKITGEDRKELMELQYQVGKLELENMELEQHRIVHDSILKGKDLTIHKLKLQLAVKDKIIKRQKSVLQENGLNRKVGYDQLAAMERALMEADCPMSPPSPPRSIANPIGRLPLQEVSHDAGWNPSSARDLPLSSVADSARGGPNEWPEIDQKHDISPNHHARIPPISRQPRNKRNSDSKVGRGVAGRKNYRREHSEGDYDGDLEVGEESEDFAVKGAGQYGVRRKEGGKHKSSHSQQDITIQSNGSDDMADSSDKFSDMQIQGLNVRKGHKGPSPMIYPDTSCDVPAKNRPGIRVGGGLGGLSSAAASQNRVIRQAGRGRGQIQNNSRWLEGGASGDADDKNSRAYPPHSPRGSSHPDRHKKGVYESKFDRETKHQHHHVESKYEDSFEELDDISDSQDYNDDFSIMSDISAEQHPSPTAPDISGGRKIGRRKKKNQALGKLKQKMRSDADSRMNMAEEGPHGGDHVHSSAHAAARPSKVKQRNVKHVPKAPAYPPPDMQINGNGNLPRGKPLPSLNR